VKNKYLSGCPISFALDLIGDKWSLLVLRDIMLWDKKYYDEFAASDEGISTNILADRLKQLESTGLVSRLQDKQNRRRYIYKPTEKAMDLLPMILEMVLWSATYDPDTGAPPHIIEQIRNDRDGYIAGVRDKFSLQENPC
jgi:DNA-binding HxlR family transcriptional regulator